MKVRDWLNNNSGLVTVLAVVLLVLSLAAIIWTSRPANYTPRVIDVYYYDLGEHKLFVDKSNKYPPIDAPSGANKGVRAYVFSCGSCSDESKRYIGYLEMYTSKAKQILENPNPDPAQAPDAVDVYEDGRLISDGKGEKWVKANTNEAFTLMDAAQTRCGKDAPKSCMPGDK